MGQMNCGVSTIRRPENPPVGQDRAAEHSQHDAHDPTREEPVRYDPRPPQAERPRHHEHGPRERAQHEAGPHEVVQPRCEADATGAADRVREGRADRHQHEEDAADRSAGGRRRRPPTALAGFDQRRPDRRREPHEVEDGEPEDHRSDQDPRTIAVVERDELVVRGADLRLRAVDEVRRDEEKDDVDAVHAPQAFSHMFTVVASGMVTVRPRGGGRAHEHLLSRGRSLRRYRVRLGHRSRRNAALISSQKSSGCSHAAKWPPFARRL